MLDVRWFAPNGYTTLLVPELRRRGLSIALDGPAPARLALSMSGTRAVDAWRYARTHGCPLVLYLWDLHHEATRSGTFDPVWWLAGRLFRFPRPLGGFPSRRGYFSRLRYIGSRALEVWVPSEMTRVAVRPSYRWILNPLRRVRCRRRRRPSRPRNQAVNRGSGM